MRTLVIESKVVSYEYFTERLEEWEGLLLLDYHQYSFRPLIEALRYDMYVSLLPYTKKGSKTKPEDIMTLPWDTTAEERTKQLKEGLKTKDELKGIGNLMASFAKTQNTNKIQ